MLGLGLDLGLGYTWGGDRVCMYGYFISVRSRIRSGVRSRVRSHLGLTLRKTRGLGFVFLPEGLGLGY